MSARLDSLESKPSIMSQLAHTRRAREIEAQQEKEFLKEYWANREMKATQKEMFDARLPLEWRDYCAHELIPLKKCRTQTLFAPWKCEEERHAFEKCQYDLYQERLALRKKFVDAQRAAEAASASK